MRCRLLSIGILGALAVLTSLAPAASAQNNFEKVRIKTVDGVDLSARFYPGNRGETPPVVMLLHGLKENSNSKEWTALAKGLQKKGFAVLTFDFRGYGSGTTEIDPALFWAAGNNLNSQYIRGPKESISSKEFKPGYYPALINDISAAKAFLDRRNDGNAGGARCNSSNLVLIGSREGATLGAIWLNSEWHRYKVKIGPNGQPQIIQNGFGGVQGVADTQQPSAGSSVVGAVWLNISPKLSVGAQSLPLDAILATAAKKQCVPMVFRYGAEDPAAKKIAHSLAAKLVIYKKLPSKGKKVPEDKYKYTGEWEVPKTKLGGADLLQDGLETVEKIVEWVDAVVQAKNNEWAEQDFRKTAYVWATGTAGLNPQVPMTGQLIKNPTELNLRFSDYYKFMGR